MILFLWCGLRYSETRCLDNGLRVRRVPNSRMDANNRIGNFLPDYLLQNDVRPDEKVSTKVRLSVVN